MMINHSTNRRKLGTVGVAMSGGVDSSVTAALLKEKGFAVRGFFMALSQPDLDQQIARVQKVADFLQIELTVVDLSQEFQQQVLDYCTTTYFNGRTPNPCMVCNYTVKFGKLLDKISAQGLDFQATGHYARIIHKPGSPSMLLKGSDPKKDQSYFLARLQQGQIARLQMVLGEYTKDRVYRLAEKIGLKGLHGKESQDVCFLKDSDLGTFLSQRREQEPQPGPIVTRDNRVLGQHRGLVNYTVGQRRGLGIPDATPFYVIGLDVENNAVIVGKKEDLIQKELIVRSVNWIAGKPPELPCKLLVKIRYRHRGAEALLDRVVDSEDLLRIGFEEPQRAITPGQFAVFYKDDEVIGSGEIC